MDKKKTTTLIILCASLAICGIAIILFAMSIENVPDQAASSTTPSSTTLSSATTESSMATTVTTDMNKKTFALAARKTSTASNAKTTKKITVPTFTHKTVATTSATKTTNNVAIATTIPKTTRAATQDELKTIYNYVYTRNILAFEQYATQQKTYIADLKEQASDLYSTYRQKLAALPEKYAAMGMLNSGAHKAAEKNLTDQYKADSKALQEKIEKAEEEYAEREKQTTDAIQKEYALEVEKFQRSTLS